jgi:hypothetical protein
MTRKRSRESSQRVGWCEPQQAEKVDESFSALENPRRSKTKVEKKLSLRWKPKREIEAPARLRKWI